MTASIDRSRMRRVRMALGCAASATALAALAACATHAPPLAADADNAAAAAAGVERINFTVEGASLDEGVEPGSLSLAEAVRLAVTTDPGVQAALARVRIALADAKQARLLPNPILNLALRFPEGGGKPVIEASLAQDIISILKIPGRSDAADNRLRQASAAAVTTVIDTVAQVQERYVSVQALEQLLPVLQQRRALVGKGVDLANARLTAGEGIREDVAVLDTQRVELEVEIAETTQELRDERLRLARLIGRPSSAATWTLEPWTSPALADATEGAWIEAGLRCRPEIQERAWKLAALGDDLALTRLLPFDGASAGLQAERDGQWRIGPEVSTPLPIFDTGQAQAERVTTEQIEARHELVQTQREVIEDVRRAWESLSRTRDNARRVRDELVPLHEQRRSLADASFKSGQSDATSLFLAEQDLRAAQTKAIELDRKAALAVIRLQRAVGGPGPAASLNVAAHQDGTVPNSSK